MGQIVGGFATSHTLFPPAGVEAQAERVIQGLLEIRRRIEALKPDLVVLAGADHLNSFSLAMQAPLAVAVADELTTLGDGTPVATFPGHRDFAERFVRHAATRDYELVQVEEVRPDHGMTIPKLGFDPHGAIPTVLLYVNAAMPAPPTPSRCWRLGQVLRGFVEEARPADERVAVVATGGLSHWLCTPRQGEIAEAFDRDFMARLVDGQGEELAKMSIEALAEASGNGGVELTAWLLMAGAMPPGTRGETLYYEPIAPWVTGMGALALEPPAAA